MMGEDGTTNSLKGKSFTPLQCSNARSYVITGVSYFNVESGKLAIHTTVDNHVILT
jgi:hypothetical protein